MRWNKKPSIKSDKTETVRTPKRGVVGYSRKSALLEEAITQMNAGKYGRSSAALKELLALDPVNMEARRLFATLHLRLGSLIPAREAFDALLTEAFQRQDYWLAESLLREYLAAGPRCVPYLEKLGTIYQEKGNVLEAVEEYGKAVDILIEDPDSERPDYAGRLYAKIRELAPASPVAFRLASFFDAETGQLVPRQPNALEADTTLPQDVLDEDSREQAASSSADGAMPWEVQVPSEGLESSALTSDPHEIAQPAAQSEHSADSLQHVPFSEQNSVRSEEVAAETSRLAEQEVVGDSLPSLGPVDSRPETPVAASDAHHGAVDADSASLQVPEPVSPEVAETPAVMEDGLVSGAVRVHSEPTDDTTGNLSSDIAEPSLPHQSQTDKEPIPSVRTEPSLSESILVSNKEDGSLTADRVERLQVEESSSPTDSPIAPAPASADETAQPWKQPGFSWKSVFDTAWKFGEQPPAKDGSTSPAPTRLEETVTGTPPIPSPQDRRVENPIRETVKGEGESRTIDEETTRSSIAPMPWDQVQESVLSITPVETSSLIAEPLEPAVDQSQDPDSTLQTGDSQLPSAPSIDDSGPELDSFSLVQTDSPSAEPINPSVDQLQDPVSAPQARDSRLPSAPSSNGSDPEPSSFSFAKDDATGHSGEQQDSAVEADAPSMTAQGTEQVVESAPLFSIVRSSQADEAVSPASQEPEPQTYTQDQGLASVVDQQEVSGGPPELAVKLEQTHSGVVTEEVGQSSKADIQTHRLQPIDEVIGGKAEIVQPFEPAPIERSVTKPVVNEGGGLSGSQGVPQALLHDDQPLEVANVHARSPIPEPKPLQQEQMEVDGSTRTSGDPAAFPVASTGPAILDRQKASQPLPAAHSTDEAFAESSQIRKVPETRTRIEESAKSQQSAATPNGVGIAIAGFLGTCFSTTQAIVRTVVGFAVLVGVCLALGLGVLALTWMIMEEPPSPTFQSFTTTPQQTLSGAQKNAYTLLVGIDAPVGQDPLRTGIERPAALGDGTTALGCFGTPGPETGDRSSASAGTIRGWVRGSDPIGQFKSNQETIQGWGSRHQVTLERYRQWQKLPFEDRGYGQPVSPPCGAMVFAHQLHVADGFVQGTDAGVDRLETDMEMWRVVLSQARTLPVKMLALQAINDDIALASGLLVRSDFETKHLGRITKFVRPLDQGELSLRWPMQSELVSAGKTYESQLQAARADGQAISAMVASALPLPKQRRLNDYAKYYEASYQVSGEKHYDALPRWKDHVRFPAAGLMDYLANPIENLVGVDPLPAWDAYNGMTVDTDAHLRLASLQAWLRRGSSDGDLPNKIAKAGQAFYDPYTGLPMLVNQKKGLLYSVGHDGKDQDADPGVDVVVEIPVTSTSANQAKSSSSSSKSR